MVRKAINTFTHTWFSGECHKALCVTFQIVCIVSLSACVGPPDLMARDEVACLGHRGDTRVALENSLSSFLAAYNNGADGTEFDVTFTKDRVPLVMHNETLDVVSESKPGMVCPLQAAIGTLELAQIRSQCRLINGEEIPILEDVLSLFSQTDFRLLIELKGHPDKQTFELIERYYSGKMGRIVVIISDKVTFANYSRLRDLVTTKAIVNQENYSHGLYDIFDGIDTQRISDADIRRLQLEDKIISMYHIDTAEALRHAFAMRVNMITSDDVGLCLEVKNEA